MKKMEVVLLLCSQATEEVRTWISHWMNNNLLKAIKIDDVKPTFLLRTFG
jgi:hypothetical protein